MQLDRLESLQPDPEMSRKELSSMALCRAILKEKARLDSGKIARYTVNNAVVPPVELIMAGFVPSREQRCAYQERLNSLVERFRKGIEA